MRKILTGILGTAMALSMSISALAGTWKQDNTGWWYDWGNGTWPASSWQWIDGNGDGTAECYYFDRFGYCMINATTPDNYQVNSSGAWVSGGVVQTRNTGAQNRATENKNTAKSRNASNALMLYDAEPLLNDDVDKKTSIVTNKENKTMTKALRFFGGEYIEYVSGGNYTKFKATVAPIKSEYWDSGDRMVVQVFGDGDEIETSQDIYYTTNMFDIEVDISGYDVIRLKALKVEGFPDYVALINPRFE